MPTTAQITAFYTKLRTNWGISKDMCPDLQQFFTEDWSEEAIATLVAEERAAMEPGRTTLMHATLSHFQSQDMSSDMGVLMLDTFRELIARLPDDLLQHEFCDGLMERLGMKYTSLSLAIGFLSYLYFTEKQREEDPFFTKHWLKSVVIPLINKGVDVDLGNHGERHTNLRRCLEVVKGKIDEGDPIFELILILLDKTKNLNSQQAWERQSEIFVLLRRKFPVEIFALFAAKGADFNLRAMRAFGETFVETPFLTHCIQRQNYQVLEFALAQKADPNLLPYSASYRLDNDLEPVITPFQYAVSVQDHRAIDIFVAWSKRTNLPLVADLPPELKNSSDLQEGLRIKMKPNDLEVTCRKHITHHQQEPLQSLLTRYGVRCYVSDPQEQAKVEAAITWLYETAPKTALGKIWAPILAGLKKKFAINPTFAIYVSDIPKQMINKNCGGLYQGGNIYVAFGDSMQQYAQVLAHEAAHMFDHEQRTLAPDARQFRLAGDEFGNRFFRDVERDRQSEQSFSGLVDGIRDAYRQHASGEPLSEYFAYLFTSYIFMRVMVLETTSEDELLLLMRTRLPESFGWYEQTYMQRPAEAEPVAEHTHVCANHH